MSDKRTTFILAAKDEASPTIRRVSGEMKTLGASATGMGGALGSVNRAATGMGGALGHAKSQLVGLASGVGLLAGGAGLLGLGGALTSSITKTEEFGVSLEKVQTLTGETAQSSGALILQFQKFGLGAEQITKVIGFTEKTLGKLNETQTKGAHGAKSAALQELELQKLQRQAHGLSTKRVDHLITEQKARDALTASMADAVDGTSKLAALDAKYGLNLIDSTGKVADFSTVLAELAKFYDSSASASTKAYVASQVLGRGYTTMIPILNEGAAGLRKASEEAASLGLNSSSTVGDIARYRDQMHELDNQVNLLQLSLGIALLPALIDVSRAITQFVSNNRTGIVSAFRQGTEVARQFAGAAASIFGVLKSGWDLVPGPLKELLIGGFVAQKASKWLLGSGPLDWAKGLLGRVAGKLPGPLGAVAGAVTATPVFVTNWPASFGVAGAVGGLVEGAVNAGLLASLGITAGTIAAVAGGMVVAAGGALLLSDAIDRHLAENPAWRPPPLAPSTTDASVQGTRALGGKGGGIIINPGAGGFGSASVQSPIFGEHSALGVALVEQRNATERAFQVYRAGERDDLMGIRGAVEHLTGAIVHSPLFKRAAEIRAEHGAPFTGPLLHRLLGARGAKIGEMAVLAQAEAIALTNNLRKIETPAKDTADLKSARQDIKDLVAVEKRIAATGDQRTADRITAAIATLRAEIARAQAITVNVSVNTSVTARDTKLAERYRARYVGHSLTAAQ